MKKRQLKKLYKKLWLNIGLIDLHIGTSRLKAQQRILSYLARVKFPRPMAKGGIVLPRNKPVTI